MQDLPLNFLLTMFFVVQKNELDSAWEQLGLGLLKGTLVFTRFGIKRATV